MKKSDLQIIAKTELTDVPSLRKILLQLPSVALMLTGLALMLHSAFPSISGVAIGITFAVVGVALLLLCNTGKDLPILPVVVIILTVACVALSNIFASSAVVLINDITNALTGLTGKIYLESSATGNPLFEAICFIILFAILTETAAASGTLLPLVPVMVIVVAGIYVGIITSIAGAVLFIAGAVLVTDITGTRALLLRLATVAVCGVVTFSAVYLLLPNADFSAVKDKVHSVVYDNRNNTMPEGRLSKFGEFDRNDTQALEVTMSSPARVYLKGRAYDTYTGSRWETADKKETAAFENNFYWLHQYGFYSQTQLGEAMMVAGKTDTSEIKIRILSACSENMYVPYGLVTTDLLDPDLIGDTYVPAGNGEAEMEMVAGRISEYFGMQEKVKNAKGERADAYHRNEESYSAYVTTFDLQIPEQTKAILDEKFGEKKDSTEDILGFVKDYLGKNITYNEKQKTIIGDEDFLTYLFDDAEKGYSVHYATAAVLMLRYFGVPARYAEGYYISTADAEKLEADKAFILTEKSAHAWAEVYLEGVGFIPFEVTPGYIENDDPGSSSSSGADNDEGNNPDSGKDKEEDGPQSDSDSDVPPDQAGNNGGNQGGDKEQSKNSRSVKSLILLIIILLIINLILITLIRRQILKTRLKSADKITPRGAVTLLYGYAVMLREKCDVTTPDDERMAEINAEARFSNHRIKEEYRQEMKAYVDKVKAECLKKMTPSEKFKMKYIYVLI